MGEVEGDVRCTGMGCGREHVLRILQQMSVECECGGCAVQGWNGKEMSVMNMIVTKGPAAGQIPRRYI